MKDICVWIVIVFEIFFGTCYAFKVWQKKADPTLSTWIIFLVGCGLSFATYVLHSKWDLKSGIINTTDLVYVVVILLAVIFWGKHKDNPIRFKPFEKWYLAGAVGIIVYGVVTGNAWNSNVLTQVLMSLAYIPMFHKMVEQKEKRDSYFAWLPAAMTSAIGLYPAIDGGNSLAVIYALRALILSSITCLIMAYYQFINPPAREPL